MKKKVWIGIILAGVGFMYLAKQRKKINRKKAEELETCFDFDLHDMLEQAILDELTRKEL